MEHNLKLDMEVVPFRSTPHDLASGKTVGKWRVIVAGKPFCYAYLFISRDGDDLECWWITPLEGSLRDNPPFLNNGQRVSNVTLRKSVRLTDWVVDQYRQRVTKPA